MRKYEITAVLPGTTADSEVVGLVERLEKILTDTGVTAISRTDLGKHKLAHEIKKNTHGTFFSFVFDADSAVTKTLENKLRLSNDLIRFVIEAHVPARYKKNPMIADTPLIKASREREREERAEREHADRADRTDRTESSVPVFTGASVAPLETMKQEDAKPIDLEAIDKKLDELLQGDLTPAI